MSKTYNEFVTEAVAKGSPAAKMKAVRKRMEKQGVKPYVVKKGGMWYAVDRVLKTAVGEAHKNKKQAEEEWWEFTTLAMASQAASQAEFGDI